MPTVTTPDQTGSKMTPKSMVAWGAVAVVGAVCWTVLALARGENVSALWILFAALSSYAIAYRFYSRFIAYKVLGVDNTRATPAERLENGIDYDVTDRRVLFGHHFAAIAGAGPLVGPVLAAQMGYLPGTIWIIVGVIFAGDRREVVPEQHPPVGDVEVGAVLEAFGRGGTVVVDTEHPVGDEAGVEPVGDGVRRERGEQDPEGGDILASDQSQHRPADRADNGHGPPTHHGPGCHLPPGLIWRRDR